MKLGDTSIDANTLPLVQVGLGISGAYAFTMTWPIVLYMKWVNRSGNASIFTDWTMRLKKSVTVSSLQTIKKNVVEKKVMNALCHGHLNLVNIHPRWGRVSTTFEKRHGAWWTKVAKENSSFGHVFNVTECSDSLLSWRRNGIPQPCQCTAVDSSIMHLQL